MSEMTMPGMDNLPAGFAFGGMGDNMEEAARILSEANSAASDDSDVPMVTDPAPGDVTLPGGFVRDGVVVLDAEVKELTGEDEEFVARAMNSANPGRMAQVLLERGVLGLGGKKPEAKELESLLLGDRDLLLLAIRRTTYGNDLDVQMLCRSCAVESRVRLDLNADIPVKGLPWAPEETTQALVLPSGKTAVMRLVTGADQAANFAATTAKPMTTLSETNSLILSRTLQEVDGQPVHPKLAMDLVRRGLSGGDRRFLVKWLMDNQPGPRYDEVKHTCTVCGEENPLGLSPADLFPSF